MTDSPIHVDWSHVAQVLEACGEAGHIDRPEELARLLNEDALRDPPMLRHRVIHLIVGMGYTDGLMSARVAAEQFIQANSSIRTREQDWCETCKDDPAGQRWLCPDRPHPQVAIDG